MPIRRPFRFGPISLSPTVAIFSIILILQLELPI